MNEAPAHYVGLDAPSPAKTGEGWSRTRWLTLIGVVFAAHLALIFLFGEHQPVVPRAVTHVPTLKLASDADALLALNDPTLFALPHQRDFASAVWLKIPAVKPPSFHWTEDPRWLLQPPAAALGAAFSQFMQTNAYASYPLDFKPVPQLRVAAWLIQPLLAQNSAMRIEGELASRQLPGQLDLPSWPFPDVIAPSKIQVLVDVAGNVVSTVLLPPGNGFTPADQYDVADQRALELARRLRFKPAPHLTVGRISFNWHTVPPAATTNEHP